jgi:glycosyltransferase involved in cell wall biosynthesis
LAMQACFLIRTIPRTLQTRFPSLKTISSARVSARRVLPECKTTTGIFWSRRFWRCIPIQNREISVICTVYNEEENINALVESLLSQSLKPKEIIITDGGSTDGTLEILKDLEEKHHTLKVYSVPGNRAKGRNAAIAKSTAEYIAVTDAGCVADPFWLEKISEPLFAGAEVASGFYEPVVQNPLEKAVAKMTIPSLKTVNPDTFLPSSRSVAFSKKAWETVDGYPEEFSHNEDTPFDLRLKSQGYTFVFVPDALVYWKPRSSFREVWRQFHQYAYGDGEALIQIRDYLLIFLRYIPLFFFPYGTFLAVLLWFLRLAKDFSKCLSIYTLPLRFTIDFADMIGFIKGLKVAWTKWRKSKSS